MCSEREHAGLTWCRGGPVAQPSEHPRPVVGAEPLEEQVQFRADLAATEGVSDSALSQRIRRGLDTLIEHALLADDLSTRKD